MIERTPGSVLQENFFVSDVRRCVMREYRIIRTASWFFSIGLVAAFLVCRLSYAQVENALPLDDPMAVVRTVLSAVKSIESPVSGRGTAIITTEKYSPNLDGKELIVDFAFKEQKSRTDIFESSGGSKGSRLQGRIKSDKYDFNYYSYTKEGWGSAEILRARGHREIRGIGEDFHPEVFKKLKSYSLVYWLETFLKAEEFEIDVSARLAGEGILHIVGRGHIVDSTRSREYDHEIQLSFDTQKELVPVLCRSTFEHPEKTTSTIVKLQWAKFNSLWYVSRAEHSSVHAGDFQRRVYITVKNFSPNVKVSDKEFTLNGLGIPDGVLVRDRVEGVTYRYGTTVNHLETGNDKDVSVTTTTDQMQTRKLWPSGIVIAGIVVFIGVVAFIGYRYFVT